MNVRTWIKTLEIVSVNDNRRIEIETHYWRLVESRGGQIRPLFHVEVGRDEILYRVDFGRDHNLPAGNQVPKSGVQLVVTGWAAELDCWLLGILLSSSAAASSRGDERRKRRWCELIRWPTGEPGANREDVERTAQALASLIGCPQHVAGKPSASVPAAISDPLAGPAEPKQPDLSRPHELPPVDYELPISGQDWTLHATSHGLSLRYTRRWVLGMFGRTVLYFLLAAAFIFLSLSALASPYAPMDQPWLPYAGLVLGVIMAGLALWKLTRTVTRSNWTFDTARSEIRRQSAAGMRGDPIPFDAVKRVWLSQKLNHEHGDSYWYDGWIHLGLESEHLRIAKVRELESDAPPDSEEEPVTPLREAAEAIGRLLDVPVIAH